MAHEGAAVVLVGLGESSLSAATQQLDRVRRCHPSCYSGRTLLTGLEVEDYSRSVTDRLGGIDFFFTNARILGRVRPFLEYPDDEFDRIVATNLKSVWLAMKILTPLLVRRGGGVIVNTASVAGLRGYRGNAGVLRNQTRRGRYNPGRRRSSRPAKIVLNALCSFFPPQSRSGCSLRLRS